MNVTVQSVVVERGGSLFEGMDVRLVEQVPEVPRPPEGWQLYQVLADTETSRYNYIPRTALADWSQPQYNITPQVVPMTVTPGYPEDTRFTVMTDAWKSLWLEVNGGDQRLFDFVTAYNTGWFNWPAAPDRSGWAHGVEGLAFGRAPGLWDNVVAGRVVAANLNTIEVLTLKPSPVPPAGISRESTPWFVHRFTLVGHKKIDKSPTFSDAVQGACYGLLVSKRAVYLPKNRVRLVR